MLLINRRLATGLLLVPIGGIRFAGAAPDATARITFVLVNDIYLMADELMPDGQRRGGFARLAAVVKAERTKASATSGHVIFAHGGDTLSPSLMSGIDHGKHIMTLTNLIPPDIFVPGNHEFDFGKATFLQRMAEAKFPPTVTTLNDQAEALRREGADFVVAVAHVTREQGYQIFRGRAVDLLLTGHTHDLFIEYSGRNAMVESSYDAHYVTAIDIVIDVSEESGRRRVRWWPQFRVIDTAMATPDPEVAAVVAQFEDELNKGLDAPIGTTAVELDSRAATVRTREAAIGNLIADAMRWSAQTEVAVTNGGGVRGDKIYPPGTTITRRVVLAELPFGNRLVTIDVLGSALKAAIENGLSQLPAPSGRFPQVADLKIEADLSRPAGNRVLSIMVGDTPLDANKTYSVATSDFMARGGDDYVAFRDAKPVLPPADSPTIAYEVIDYIKSIGTIRTAVDGRIVLS